MQSFGEFILLLIRQFSGGPGPIENNLTRFGLAAVFWLVLLVVSWSRQRNQNLPREKLLIWGFGLALVRELIMFGLTTRRITGFLDYGGEDIYFHPLEHGLEMAAVIVVAGAFLRFALDDVRISRAYLQIGLSIAIMAMLVIFITWPKIAYANPSIHFNETGESRIFHILSFGLIAAAIFILARKRGWLQNVVSLALGFLLISEILLLVSFATHNIYSYILCPLSNTFHILAIPIFGFVYLKEMSIEKKITEEKLQNYRDHLEYLVDERTSMLVAQNAIVDSLSQSLDLKTILSLALDKIIPVLSMELGLIFLLDRDQDVLSLESYRGRISQEDLELCIIEGCPYEKISKEGINDKQVIIHHPTAEGLPKVTHIKREGIQSLISSPLISKDRIVGALTLGSKKYDPLNQTNLELLVAVCNQIGMAVVNAYLYQEAEIWAQELSTLHQASINLRSTLDSEQIHKEIAAQSIKLTGCQMAFIICWEHQSDTLEIISSIGMQSETADLLAKVSIMHRLLDEMRTTRKSITIDDVQQDARIPKAWKLRLDFHSLMCAPVWGVNEPTEFLFIMEQRENKAWHAKDVELVESFISRAAIALENANLHKQLEWAAALEERQRIAANIHDGVAQMINLVGLKVDQTVDLIPSHSNGKILEALGNIRETVGRASVEVRKSIASLQNTPQPRKSLQEIITTLAEEWLADDIFILEISLSFPEPLFIPPDHIAQVLPIVQEAIINAQKHSDASKIKIHGQQQDDLVTITIKDDGIGFNVNELNTDDGSHFGLKIMRARAARFNGNLQIISKLNRGTTITLSWKLNCKPDNERYYENLVVQNYQS
jgi:signal transduction histidine kinase